MNSIAHRTDSATTVPAVDLTTTGRALPFVSDGAREHTEAPLTAEQSVLVTDDGLGAHITAPVETALRDFDDNATADENAQTPFLAAQIVVSDYRSQAYGRRTQVWLHYGQTVGSITPAKAREALDAMRAFLPRLEAVVELAEQEAAGDFEGDPEIAAADREAEVARIRAITEDRA